MMGVSVWDDIFGQCENPRFGVSLYGGETRFYGKGTSPLFILHIDTPETAKRLLTEGSMGFGESYMLGSLRIDGDLDAYLRLRHTVTLKPTLRVLAAQFLARLSTMERREAQIGYHYDTGDDLFSLFLDTETMSYSAGSYRGKAMSLADAQKEKFTLVCDRLALREGARILDLGSGWGGFSLFAARERSLIVHGETLSKNQLAFAERRLAQEGLEARVSYVYRDFMEPRMADESYDGAVMIEAIEHVGQSKLPTFLRSIAGALRPGAPLYIQFTGRYVPKAVDRWTLRYVFPGGHLPSKAEFLDAALVADLAAEEFEDDTPDYDATLSAWIESLESNRKIIVDRYGVPNFRLWQLFLRGARVNFRMGDMSLFRVLLRKLS